MPPPSAPRQVPWPLRNSACRPRASASRNSAQSPGSTNGQRSLPTLGRGPDNLTERTANALSNATDSQQQQQAISETRPTSAGPGPSPTPPTTVLVSHGRFFREEPYIVSSFNNQTLAAAPNPQNNAALRSPSSIANGQVTLTLDDGRSVTLPWQPTNIVFPVMVNDPTFGTLAGIGLVSPRSEFFAYLLFDSSNRPLGIVAGTPTTFAQFPKTGFAEHILLNLSSLGTVPFVNGAVGLNADLAGNAMISTLKSAFSPNVGLGVGDPVPNAQRSRCPAGGGFGCRARANQKSYMGVFIGQYFRDTETSSVALAGRYSGTYRLAANQPIGRLTSAASTFSTGTSNSIYGTDASAMVLTPDGLTTTYTDNGSTITGATTVRTPQASFDQPYNNLNGSSYYSINGALRVDSPDYPTQPGARTDRTMNGFVGGLVEGRDSAGNITTRQLGSTTTGPGNVIIKTDPAANRASATFNVNNWDTGTSASFRLGGTSGAAYATSAFIDDKNWATARSACGRPDRHHLRDQGEQHLRRYGRTVADGCRIVGYRFARQLLCCIRRDALLVRLLELGRVGWRHSLQCQQRLQSWRPRSPQFRELRRRDADAAGPAAQHGQCDL